MVGAISFSFIARYYGGGWLVGWLVGWMVGWLVNWLVGLAWFLIPPYICFPFFRVWWTGVGVSGFLLQLPDSTGAYDKSLPNTNITINPLLLLHDLSNLVFPDQAVFKPVLFDIMIWWYNYGDTTTTTIIIIIMIIKSGQGAIVCKSRAAHLALITCNMSCAMRYEGTYVLLWAVLLWGTTYCAHTNERGEGQRAVRKHCEWTGLGCISPKNELLACCWTTDCLEPCWFFGKVLVGALLMEGPWLLRADVGKTLQAEQQSTCISVVDNWTAAYLYRCGC